MVSKIKRRVYQDFARRLSQACKDAALPEKGRPAKLGGLVGVGYKGAEKWLNGLGMPDMGHASALATVLGVSFEWLITGRGPMRISESLQVQEKQTPYEKLTAPEIEFATHFKYMPPLGQKMMVEYIMMIQKLMEEHQDIFVNSKAEKANYLRWEASFRRLKKVSTTGIF